MENKELIVRLSSMLDNTDMLNVFNNQTIQIQYKWQYEYKINGLLHTERKYHSSSPSIKHTSLNNSRKAHSHYNHIGGSYCSNFELELHNSWHNCKYKVDLKVLMSCYFSIDCKSSFYNCMTSEFEKLSPIS